MKTLHRPATVAEALVLLDEHARNGAPLVPIAGGTDIYPAHVGRALSTGLLDLSLLGEMRTVVPSVLDGAPGVRIGALTTWRTLGERLAGALLDPAFDALYMAAREVGGVQVQSRATVGGNLCHASPAADGAPLLLALGAAVELRSRHGRRWLPVEEFLLGPRTTARRGDELLEAIWLPMPAATTRSRSVFLKLGQRRYLVISAVMVAASLSWSNDDTPRVASCRLAVGACGPKAVRLRVLEQQVDGMNAAQLRAWSDCLHQDDLTDALDPIDDLRGTRAYRLEMADLLVRRALRALSPVAHAALAA